MRSWSVNNRRGFPTPARAFENKDENTPHSLPSMSTFNNVNFACPSRTIVSRSDSAFMKVSTEPVTDDNACLCHVNAPVRTSSSGTASGKAPMDGSNACTSQPVLAIKSSSKDTSSRMPYEYTMHLSRSFIVANPQTHFPPSPTRPMRWREWHVYESRNQSHKYIPRVSSQGSGRHCTPSLFSGTERDARLKAIVFSSS